MAGKTMTKLAAGMKVRVKEGVPVPEFPERTCSHWTGEIVDLIGKKSAPKYVIQWDDETVAGFDDEYIKACEEKNLYHLMGCFEIDDLEEIDS